MFKGEISPLASGTRHQTVVRRRSTLERLLGTHGPSFCGHFRSEVQRGQKLADQLSPAPKRPAPSKFSSGSHVNVLRFPFILQWGWFPLSPTMWVCLLWDLDPFPWLDMAGSSFRLRDPPKWPNGDPYSFPN